MLILLRRGAKKWSICAALHTSLITLTLALIVTAAVSAAAVAVPARPRLVILMIWDGLRPDSVTQAVTPNLYALKNQGVYFANHHSIYPSLTMVNAAGLATAAAPGVSGIIGNSMYFANLLGSASPPSDDELTRLRTLPVSLETPSTLAALSGPGGLDSKLVAVESIAQQLLGKGGFVGIVGKTGPTFMFDDKVAAQFHDGTSNEIFVSDDRVMPQSLADQLKLATSPAAVTAAFRRNPPMGDQDAQLAQVVINKALPAAAGSLAANRPALLVFWQHNPDISEHGAGLGNAVVDRALAICDANLGGLRAAIEKLGLADRMDLLVVSDHGFATIKARVNFTDLLIAQGLKKSRNSDDVVVARNYGSDEIYLSPRLDRPARAALARKIVEYTAAQPWSGPIFSRAAAPQAARGYAGEIPGTFDEAWFGLLNPARSADLIVSFRENPDEDNSKLSGPQAPATALDGKGMRNEPNHSQPLLRPVMGVAYADTGAATSGQGTHGSLGVYEMHNFGAATGPDFLRGYIDKAPSSNLDIGRTVAALLGIPNPTVAQQPSDIGRVLTEALKNGAPAPGPYHRVPLRVTLDLPGQRLVTTIQMDGINGERYPIGASFEVVPANQKASVPANSG